MGLISSAIGLAGSVVGDQFREFFYCPTLESDVLVKKGEKKSTKKGFNKGSDNLITNGSVVTVNDGQAMMIVDQGFIVEFCAEPGEFVYDTSTEPSIFTGKLSESIVSTFKQYMKRMSFGGETGKDQRVYYFNTKEILGNKYGTVNPVPFRVVDTNIGLDIDISIRCHGEFAYRLVDPMLFYKNISGNVQDEYNREGIDSQLRTDILTALQPAFGKISAMGIRYSTITTHTAELCKALNEELAEKWTNRFGIAISSFGVNSVTASKEDEDMIKELQKGAVFRNSNMAAAHLVQAQAEAMKSAASNTSAGPMMAFAGMNMASNAGGMNAANLFQMGQQQQQMQQQPVQQQAAQGWACSCGTGGNTGKFCGNCGNPKPQESGEWTCSCGTHNTGKFCGNCGNKKPESKCSKCGWEPTAGQATPKFCPECGNSF